MAGKITWSPLANQKRKEILAFWIHHNKSNVYSIKLNNLFKASAQLIAVYPNIGKSTTDPKVRFKIVRDYFLFYEVVDKEIIIFTIWDNRQNPENLTIK